MSASMAEGMATILAEHYIDITETSPDNIGRCVCGNWTADTMSISWDEHQAEVLAANGYGKLEDAWAEGHYSGEWNYQHRRMIEAHPHEARKNPYRQDADK